MPLPNGLDEAANNVGLHRWESSDPRLTGDVIVANSALVDPDEGNVLTVSTYEPTNDGVAGSVSTPPSVVTTSSAPTSGISVPSSSSGGMAMKG